MLAKVCSLGALALAGVVVMNSPAPAATVRACDGSPLAMWDNVGETILHGIHTTRSVVGIAKLNRKNSGQLAGWLYLDDAGIVYVVLRTADDAAAFGGKLGTGPFPVLRGLPLGFAAAPCN